MFIFSNITFKLTRLYFKPSEEQTDVALLEMSFMSSMKCSVK